MKLRKEIYAPGGSRDIDVSIRNFLGRDRSIQPYLKTLGIETPAKASQPRKRAAPAKRPRSRSVLQACHPERATRAKRPFSVRARPLRASGTGPFALVGCNETLVRFSLAVFATSLFADAAPIEPPKEAENAIDAAGLLEHIKVLGSDKFEGRAPGSKGEEESVNYITAQFKKLGLKPGNPNGTYTQEVPLAGILGDADRRLHRRRPEDGTAFA